MNLIYTIEVLGNRKIVRFRHSFTVVWIWFEKMSYSNISLIFFRVFSGLIMKILIKYWLQFKEFRNIRKRKRADLKDQKKENVDANFKRYDKNEVEDLTACQFYQS